MDANEIEHRKKMQGIIQRIPTGIPDGCLSLVFMIRGNKTSRSAEGVYEMLERIGS